MAGTFRTIIIAMACAAVRRIPASSPTAAKRDTAGSAAVAMDTPNSPMGRYINLNANDNHETAPVP